MALPAVWGGQVPDEGVVVEVDEVVVEVVELEAKKTDLGDGLGSRVESKVEETGVGDGLGSMTARAAAGCWVLWVMRSRVRFGALGACMHFPWYPVCVQGLVLWVVSCVVPAGVTELPPMRA